MMLLWQDLRFAVRTLGRRPVFALAVVLVLGLGIGASTAVVDLTNLLAWRQLPAERPDELVKIFTASRRGFTGRYGGTSYPDYLDYRQASSLIGLSAHTDLELRLDTGESSRYAWAAAVSGNYFEVLGLRMSRGRALGATDDRPGAEPVIVISHHLWQRLGADPGLVGSTLALEGESFTIVGVGSPGFTSTTAGTITDLFLPLAALPAVLAENRHSLLESRQAARFSLLGRLAPGFSRQTAEAELAVLARQLDQDHPLAAGEARQVSATAAKITHPVDLERMAPSLRLFGAAVLLLLVITCANVAHLLLARTMARGREMAVRRAVGASRGVVVRQVLTECLLLALGGGLLGLLLTRWARTFLVTYASAEFAGEMRFDARVLGGAFLVCLVATVLAGLTPALAASRMGLATTLKDGGARRWGSGQVLAAAQVALCVVLLVAGALLARSLVNRLDADLGFDDEGLLMAAVSLPEKDYPRQQGIDFFRRLVESARALPGVDGAATAVIVPPIFFEISLPLRLPEDPEQARSSRVNVVDGGYFETMGLALHAGRVFDATEQGSDNGTVVVNRLLAQQLWPGEDPLGRTVLVDASRPGDLGPELTVIGVVGNVSQHRGAPGGEPLLYFSSAQRYRSLQKLVLRSAVEPAVVFDQLRELVRRMDPGVAISNPRTGATNRREAFVFETMQAQAVGVFAVLGFVLAMIGIFGVLSYSVSRRRREMGIRMALGARRRDVRRQVIAEGMRLAIGGAVIGLLATGLMARLLENLLFGVTAGDLRVLSAVAALVLAAAAVAAYLPARRASLRNPLDALRQD